MHAQSLSRVRLFATAWTVAAQAPPSMGFSRQEYWSGVPLPPPGDLPHPGIEPRSPALQADALPSEPPRKPEERNTSKGGKSLTSQDLAKQTYSSTSSSLSSKKQPMNLTDSSKLIQVSAVTLDMIKVRLHGK